MRRFCICLLAAIGFVAFHSPSWAGDEDKIQLVITGGHETDPRDRGRPVILIGNALGVTPEVFREAFSHVKPAPGGEQPDPAQVQRNKAALLKALGPYRVTNELLDRVSNITVIALKAAPCGPPRPPLLL